MAPHRQPHSHHQLGRHLHHLGPPHREENHHPHRPHQQGEHGCMAPLRRPHRHHRYLGTHPNLSPRRHPGARLHIRATPRPRGGELRQLDPSRPRRPGRRSLASAARPGTGRWEQTPRNTGPVLRTTDRLRRWAPGPGCFPSWWFRLGPLLRRSPAQPASPRPPNASPTVVRQPYSASTRPQGKRTPPRSADTPNANLPDVRRSSRRERQPNRQTPALQRKHTTGRQAQPASASRRVPGAEVRSACRLPERFRLGPLLRRSPAQPASPPTTQRQPSRHPPALPTGTPAQPSNASATAQAHDE